MSRAKDHKIAIKNRTQSPSLRSWSHVGRGDTVVVCFSGVGKPDEVCPPYEFARTATFNGTGHALFIADPTRSWMNAQALLAQTALEVVRFKQKVGARRVVAMGHSMGGFSALVLPSLIQVEQVLAFAPQISVHPNLVPDEARWTEYRDQITDYAVPSIEPLLTRDTHYTVIHGAHHREAPQRDRFPRFETLAHYVLAGTHHNVPQRLKREGALQQVVRLALTGRRRKLRQLMVQDLGASIRSSAFTAHADTALLPTP